MPSRNPAHSQQPPATHTTNQKWLTAEFLQAFLKQQGLPLSFERIDPTCECESLLGGAVLKVKQSSRLLNLSAGNLIARWQPDEEAETPPQIKELIATAALVCCDKGLDPLAALSEASRIRGIEIADTAAFLCEYANELTEAVNSILDARWQTLKRTAKLRTAAALRSILSTGAIERSFIELIEALSSDDQATRERAAKQIRDIAIKLSFDQERPTKARGGAVNDQEQPKEQLRFFLAAPQEDEE